MEKKILFDNCNNGMNGKKSARHLFSFLIHIFSNFYSSGTQMLYRVKIDTSCDRREKIIFHQLSIMWRLMNKMRDGIKDGHQVMIKNIMKREKKMLNMQEKLLTASSSAVGLWNALSCQPCMCSVEWHSERLRLLVMVVTRSQFIVHHAEQGWG